MVVEVDEKFINKNISTVDNNSSYTFSNDHMVKFLSTEFVSKETVEDFWDAFKNTIIMGIQFCDMKADKDHRSSTVLDPYNFTECLKILFNIYCTSSIYKIVNIEYDPLFILCKYSKQQVSNKFIIKHGSCEQSSRGWTWLNSDGERLCTYMPLVPDEGSGLSKLLCYYGNYFITVKDVANNKDYIYAITYTLKNDRYGTETFILPTIRQLKQEEYDSLKDVVDKMNETNSNYKFEIFKPITDTIL